MFESVDRIVMKEEKLNKTKLVIFRLTPKEYANLEAKRGRTTLIVRLMFTKLKMVVHWRL